MEEVKGSNPFRSTKLDNNLATVRTFSCAFPRALADFILKSMPLALTKTPLLLLLLTAFTSSRLLFFFFHDPEGPNLLIVTVLALILFSASFLAWRFIPATTSRKLLLAICAQVVIVTGLYTIS